MPARQSSATDKALRLVAKGLTIRAAAKRAGVAVSTLTRARKRLGAAPLKVGARPRA